MQQQGKFILMNMQEFKDWLFKTNFTRQIKLIQQHHTAGNSKNFKGDYFSKLKSMEASHLQRGFSEIAQNLTIFPDGMVAICRNFNISPAGIKGANSNGICIEIVGFFDIGKEIMNDVQKDAVIKVNAMLCKRFNLAPSLNTLVYHTWYDLETGERINDNKKNHITKSCPGTNFFNGNTTVAAQKYFIPLVVKALNDLNKPVVKPTPNPTPTLKRIQITVDNTNIRKTYLPNSPILTKAHINDQFNSTKIVGQFYEIVYMGGLAYVSVTCAKVI